MKEKFKYIFLGIAILQLAGVYFSDDLRILTKPFIMISLGLYYFRYVKSFSILFFIALVGAFLGDLFLMWSGNLFFALGLGSFLVMQILYIIVFLEDRGIFTRIDLAGTALLLAIGTVVLYLLMPAIDGWLKAGVAVYAVSITAMTISALWRNKGTKIYIPLLAGALLFMLSDSTLAYNKFVEPLDHGDAMVMITYMAAQFLIVTRMTERQPSSNL